MTAHRDIASPDATSGDPPDPGRRGIRGIPDTPGGRSTETMDDMNEQSGPSTGIRRADQTEATRASAAGQHGPRSAASTCATWPVAPQHHRPLLRRCRRRSGPAPRHRPHDHPGGARRPHLLRRRRPARLRRVLAVRARGRPGPRPHRAGSEVRRVILIVAAVVALRSSSAPRSSVTAAASSFPLFPFLVIGLIGLVIYAARGQRRPGTTPQRTTPALGQHVRPRPPPRKVPPSLHRHPRRPGSRVGPIEQPAGSWASNQPPAWMPPPGTGLRPTAAATAPHRAGAVLADPRADRDRPGAARHLRHREPASPSRRTPHWRSRSPR